MMCWASIYLVAFLAILEDPKTKILPLARPGSRLAIFNNF